MTIRTVVFDLDGTLIDSLGLILASYRHTMQTHLGHHLPDDLWIAGMGTPLAIQMRSFACEADAVEEMVETYTTHNLANHDRLVRPYAGVRESVKALRDRGVTLAIATSKRSTATLMGLRACDLPEDWFAAVITADDVTRPKPDAEPVLLALAQSGETDPSRAVYVGDSIHDMQSGRAAGVTTAAALWGPNTRETLQATNPDRWLTVPAEIESLVS
ncbi:MAG: HAD family hydrolase [Gemmatimonadales bacterium]|nr:MAG: HAD family hydrolase [Gemmatimonadales bacterium]